VETCFEGFTCVYAADLQEEEKNLEGVQESLVATEYYVVDQENMSNDFCVRGETSETTRRADSEEPIWPLMCQGRGDCADWWMRSQSRRDVLRHSARGV